MLLPKLVTTLRTYDRAQLAADLTAGVIVGVVALPLAIAFAIGSDRRLYTAISAGGIRATGAIPRTATNVKSGGGTPGAGIVHALTLVVVTLFFGRLAAW